MLGYRCFNEYKQEKQVAYKNVKKYFLNLSNPKSEAIEYREGTIIYEQDHTAEIQKEYLQILYNEKYLTGEVPIERDKRNL